MITTIIQADSQGMDSVAEVISASKKSELQTLMLDWATAMAVSGWEKSNGDQLVPDSEVPNYPEPSTIVVADPANPVAGELYGANGANTGSRDGSERISPRIYFQ